MVALYAYVLDSYSANILGPYIIKEYTRLWSQSWLYVCQFVWSGYYEIELSDILVFFRVVFKFAILLITNGIYPPFYRLIRISPRCGLGSLDKILLMEWRYPRL